MGSLLLTDLGSVGQSGILPDDSVPGSGGVTPF